MTGRHMDNGDITADERKRRDLEELKRRMDARANRAEAARTSSNVEELRRRLAERRAEGERNSSGEGRGRVRCGHEAGKRLGVMDQVLEYAYACSPVLGGLFVLLVGVLMCQMAAAVSFIRPYALPAAQAGQLGEDTQAPENPFAGVMAAATALADRIAPDGADTSPEPGLRCYDLEMDDNASPDALAQAEQWAVRTWDAVAGDPPDGNGLLDGTDVPEPFRRGVWNTV